MGDTNTTFKFDSISKTWNLTVNANCKNYGNEYQKFLDYIQPYIDEEGFLGFIRYEESENPTLIYNDVDEKKIVYKSPNI